MTRYFVLTYTKELGTRPAIKACLNSLPEVISWRSELPNSFFLQSESDAGTIGRALIKCLSPELPRFFIAEVTKVPSGSNYGWLTDASWEFLGQRHKNSPKQEDT
jgi:hypothetical protein